MGRDALPASGSAGFCAVAPAPQLFPYKRPSAFEARLRRVRRTNALRFGFASRECTRQERGSDAELIDRCLAEPARIVRELERVQATPRGRGSAAGSSRSTHGRLRSSATTFSCASHSSDNFAVDIAELKRLGDVQAVAVRAQAVAAIAVIVALLSLGAAIFALSRTNTPGDRIEESAESRESILDGKLDEMRRRIEQLESDTDSIRHRVDVMEDRLHP